MRHGESYRTGRTPEYVAWVNMIARCENPKTTGYRNWGGRGVRVCRRWRESFETFLADVGRRPSREHSLDRHPNADGHYEPGNVRWATRKQQCRNRRGNRMLSAFGETRCMAEWAELHGVAVHTVKNRLRLGWSLENALTVPTNPRRFMFRGSARTADEICSLTGISPSSFWRRVGTTGDAEEAVREWRSNGRGKNQKRHKKGYEDVAAE